MKLKLKNPIVFFDLETTGINVATDRIVEISYLKVYPNGNEETKTFKVNPTIPIPKESSDIHGILDEDVKDSPTFAELAKTIANDLEGCDIAGYNSNKFDIPLLAEEMIRAEVDIDFKKRKLVDVQVIFLKKEPRTLTAAYKYYCDKDLSNAHSAEADTHATYEILKSQLDMYSDLENDIEKLSEFSSHNKNADFMGRIIFNDKGEETFNFGKYKAKTVEWVFEKDPAYYGWMMNNDFPLYTKKVLTNIKLSYAFKNNKS
ncbi:MAG: 3'-5' exonuclease [Bacteroidales bacterium]|nr:3'-5' exonuclease [Bacteroidales bacterium]MBN2819615.1 3'-5' exonuclease [Bacteroidales bacterium]